MSGVWSGSPHGGGLPGNFAGVGPTFSPLQIPNCKAWYRADLGVTVSTGVSNWVDQSSVMLPLTNASGPGQPTLNASDPAYGGQATISFNGTSHQLSNASDGGLTAPFTQYVLCESDGTGAQQNITIDGNTELIAVTVGTQFGFYGGAGLYDPITVGTFGTPQMICCVANNTASAVYRNSLTPRIIGTTGASNALGGQFGLGSGGGINFLQGKIAEVIMYAGVHKPADVARIFSYWAQRYKLPFPSIVGPTFNPASIAPCQLWLRADLGITLNGNTVSAWNDLSGSGNNCSQGTGVNQPGYNASDPAYGGQPTLSFSSNQVLTNTTLAPAQPYTVVLVGECDSGSQTGFFGAYGNGTSPLAGILYATTASPPDAQFYCGAALATGVAINVPSLITGVFNGASTFGYVNSTAAGQQVTGNAGTNVFSGGYAVGSSNGAPSALNGKIAEILVYTGALTSAQLAQVYAYVAQRYNLNVG